MKVYCVRIAVLLSLSIVFAASLYAAGKTKPTTCRQCGMKITEQDRKFEIYVLEGIEATAFDDIGCAVLWYDNECANRQSAFDSNAFAHDYHSGEPVSAEKAAYAVCTDLKTPMGYGIAAFKTRATAETYAAGRKECGVRSYNEVMSMKLKQR